MQQFGNPQPSGCLLSSCVAWLVTFKKPMDYQWKCQSDVGACNSRFKFWYLHGSLCISSALKMFSWCKVQMGMPFLCKNTQTKGIAHGTPGMDMVKHSKEVAANHLCEVGMKAQSPCFLLNWYVFSSSSIKRSKNSTGMTGTCEPTANRMVWSTMDLKSCICQKILVITSCISPGSRIDQTKGMTWSSCDDGGWKNQIIDPSRSHACLKMKRLWQFLTRVRLHSNGHM